METLALMLVVRRAVPARRDPTGNRRGPLRPVPPADHAGARRDADRPRVRVPDAGRDPLLDRAGRRGRLDDDLRDPAGDPDHGTRDPRSAGEHGRGGRVDGRHPDAAARQGAAPARPAHDPAGRQPDDPLRALDGRDRRLDRRRRPRGGRHQRPLLEPGSRDPRRARDRGDGDGPRPLLRGDRASGPIRRTSTSTRRGSDESRRSALVAAIVAGVVALESLRRRRRLPGRGREPATHGDDRGVAAGQDPGRARLRAGPDHLGLRDHRASRHLHPPAAPAAAAGVPGRGARGSRLSSG